MLGLQKIKNIFEFFKSTLGINCACSIIPLAFDFKLENFIITSITIGYLASIIFKELKHKNEYIFYANNGISKFELNFFGYFLTLLTALVIAIFNVIIS